MVLFGLAWDPESIEDESEIASSESRKVIALIVRELREQLGLTQDKLAARSGLGVRHVGKLESGSDDPRFTTLWRSIKGFGLNWEQFGRTADKVIARRAHKRKSA